MAYARVSAHSVWDDPAPGLSGLGDPLSLAMPAQLRYRSAMTDRDPPKDLALLWRLIAENGWAHRWGYGAALLLMMIVSGMTAAVALITGPMFETLFQENSLEPFQRIAGLILVVFILRGLALYGQTVLLARIGNRVVADLQRRLYDHILAQGMGFHARHGTGDLANRLSQNTNQIRQGLQLIATRLGTDVFSVLSLLGVMLWADWQLTLYALIGLPVILGGIALLVRRVKKQARAEIAMQARILSAINETVLGARIIRAFNLQPQMQRRMGYAIDGVRDRADRIAQLQGAVNPLMETMAGLAAACAILLGGARVVGGALEPASFISFATALIMIGDPARRLGQLNVLIRQYLAAAEFIYATLDTHVGQQDAPGAPDLIVTRGDVRFENVHFAYEGDRRRALDGMSLHAPAGQVTALVGPSGGGKSTLLNLLERFYEPSAGRIVIDGQDIAKTRLASLRSQMAMVTQETFLFDATIAENIAFGRPDAARAEIEAAAREANAHEFIMAMPEGYASPVGEGGANLSGGQRQRVAIARAMLRNATILLLDEATSALDAASEAHVQEALSRLMQGRTTLVIAHRLATVRRAHNICVVEAGRLAERGTHDDLIAAGGLYARLAALQFGQPQAEDIP
ncbi:MAG: ABC transporter ATP-binding protein [Pseudomonadota bacterium]